MNPLIIFDCDGVLVDSEPLANQALVDCLLEHKISLSVDEAVQRFMGRKLADCLAEIEKEWLCVLPTTFEAELRRRRSEYFESRLRPIAGVGEALKKISHRKCVASNGPHHVSKRNLEIVGLLDHFGENIFSAYTIQKWKPDPSLFLHACKSLASRPEHCVVIEDSEAGVKAARAGGFKVLAFGLTSSPDRDVYAFHKMSELQALIDHVFQIETRSVAIHLQ